MENQSFSSENQESSTNKILEKIKGLDIKKQALLIFSTSLSIALILIVILWNTGTEYKILYASLSKDEVAKIAKFLDKNGVDYKLNAKTDGILVPKDDVYSLRIKLSEVGLPENKSLANDILNVKSEFGTSNRIERARLKKAQEIDLAKTIEAIKPVKKAVVHIAYPDSSVFIRNRGKVSASVMIDVGNEEISDEQVEAIVNLISHSIPNLRKENVSVADQNGVVLSTRALLKSNKKKLTYKARLEDEYVQKIQDILEPIVGKGKVRSRVTLNIDYVDKEITSEEFGKKGVLRSEQLSSSRRERTTKDKSQVPGALTNKPIDTGIVGGSTNSNLYDKESKNDQVHNYELDKKVTHYTEKTPIIKKMSVAVVVDTLYEKQGGELISVPRDKEQMVEIQKLVERAIGIDKKRDDEIEVKSFPFANATINAKDDKNSFDWTQPWVLDLVKILASTIIVLLVVFLFLKPMFNFIIEPPPPPEEEPEPEPEEIDELEALEIEAERKRREREILNKKYKDELEDVENIIKEEPKILTQVISEWVKGGI